MSTTDPTTSKEAWLCHVLEMRNRVWKSYEEDDATLVHVILYLREDPKKLPGIPLEERAAHMFAGHFYNGPDAVMPIEQFKAAWAQIVVFTAIAGVGIASIVYQELWTLDLPKGETPPEDYSTDPRAKDVFVFRAEHLDYGCDWWSAEIERPDGKRKMTNFEKRDGAIAGRMFEFLPRDKPTVPQRMAAQFALQRLNEGNPES